MINGYELRLYEISDIASNIFTLHDIKHYYKIYNNLVEFYLGEYVIDLYPGISEVYNDLYYRGVHRSNLKSTFLTDAIYKGPIIFSHMINTSRCNYCVAGFLDCEKWKHTTFDI